MVQGRNSTVVSIRLPDEIVSKLKEKAGKLSVGEYIKGQILKSLSVNTKTAYN